MSPTVKLPCWLTARTCTTSSLLGRCLNGPNWGRRKILQSFQSWSDRVFIDSLNAFLMLVHALSSTIHSKHMQLIEFVRQIHPQHKNLKAFQIIKIPYPSPRLGDPGCGQSSHLEVWIITHLFGSCRVDHKFRALHSDGSLKRPPKKCQEKSRLAFKGCYSKKNLAKVSPKKNQQILNPAKLSEQAFWPPEESLNSWHLCNVGGEHDFAHTRWSGFKDLLLLLWCHLGISLRGAQGVYVVRPSVWCVGCC